MGVGPSRARIASFVGAVVGFLALGACQSTKSVETLISERPALVGHSAQVPPEALSLLSLAGEESVGKVEYVDQAARRVVFSQIHPYMGFRMAMIVTTAEPNERGSTISIWTDGLKPARGTWPQRLWEAYSKRLDAMGAWHDQAAPPGDGDK